MRQQYHDNKTRETIRERKLQPNNPPKIDTKNLNKIYCKSNKQRTLTKYTANQIQQHVDNNNKIVHHD